MIILFGTPGWGWKMFGLLGKQNKWFLGFSLLNKRSNKVNSGFSNRGESHETRNT